MLRDDSPSVCFRRTRLADRLAKAVGAEQAPGVLQRAADGAAEDRLKELAAEGLALAHVIERAIEDGKAVVELKIQEDHAPAGLLQVISDPGAEHARADNDDVPAHL